MNTISERKPTLLLVALVLLVGCSTRISLRSGDRIVFFGDSITELGVKPNGYVTLIKEELNSRHPDLGIEVIGAGISGNKVTDLLNRLGRDVLDKKPNVVVIYIGINDVWHWVLKNLKGTPKDEYERGLREIIARIQYSGAEVILCTPSVIGEKHDGTNPQDAMLEEYASISRRVTMELGVRVCDLRKSFIEHLSQHNKDNKEQDILTYDRVHLNDAGNRFVAQEILKSLGEQ